MNRWSWHEAYLRAAMLARRDRRQSFPGPEAASIASHGRVIAITGSAREPGWSPPMAGHAMVTPPPGGRSGWLLNAEGLWPRARNQASRRAVIKSSLRRWLHWHSLLKPYGQSPRPYVHMHRRPWGKHPLPALGTSPPGCGGSATSPVM